MSGNPTRCVSTIDQIGELCLWIDVESDGTACSAATWNGRPCASCEYISTGLCNTTTAGYSVDCSPQHTDLILCGSRLTSVQVVNHGDDDQGGVRTGPLVFFILLLVISSIIRAYIEVRRCREGLQEGDEKSEQKTQENDEETPPQPEAPKAFEFGNVEFPAPEFDETSHSFKSNEQRKNDLEGEVFEKSNCVRSSKSKGSRSNHSETSKKRSKSRDSPKQNSAKSAIKNPNPRKEPKKSASARKSNDSKGATDGSLPYKAPPPNDVDGNDNFSVLSNSLLPGVKFASYNEVKDDSKAAALRKYHRKGDWESIRDLFSKIRRRIIERQHYIGLLVGWIAKDWPEPIGEDTIFCDYLDAWNKAEPENLQCNVIRLEVWIAWAWHGRTKAFAHEISPERVTLFYERMDKAAAELERVLKVTKKRDALVYAAAIKIATGRNDDQAVVQQYMEAVQSSNDPANYNFHTRAMEYFCEKWHGSHNEMMDYAKWITSQLPDGHPLWILIPVAHYERAILIETPAARMAYWHKQHDSIVKAYEKALGGPWETKVNPDVSPACRKLDAVVRNWFVYALGRCRASELAQRQARVIGKTPLADLPWDKTNTYAKHVKALGFQI